MKKLFLFLTLLLSFNIANAQEDSCLAPTPESAQILAGRIWSIFSRLYDSDEEVLAASLDSLRRWQPENQIWDILKPEIERSLRERSSGTEIIEERLFESKIKEDLDNQLRFFDDITSEGVLSLEGVTDRIVTSVSDADGIVFGEDHDVKKEKDAIAFILSKIGKAYTIGAFLEESGGEGRRLFSSGYILEGYELREYPQLDKLGGIRIQDGFQPYEQFFPCIKINEIFDLLNSNELLGIYVGSAHTTRLFLDYMPEFFKSSGFGEYPTVDDCFQSTGKSLIAVVMSKEIRILDAIQNEWLNEILKEDTNPEVLLEKTEIFKNRWNQKMVGYPQGDYFAHHPTYKKVYFGIFPSNRSPRIVTLFEKVLRENEDIAERLRNGEFDSVRVDYDARIDWDYVGSTPTTFIAAYARVEFINSENPSDSIQVLTNQDSL